MVSRLPVFCPAGENRSTMMQLGAPDYKTGG